MAAGTIVAGFVSGACSAAIIALINTALNRVGFSRTLLVVGFAGLVTGKVTSHVGSRLLLNYLVQRTLADVCRDLSRRVIATPLRQLESIGIPRILATLTDDVAMIGLAAQQVPSLAMNVAVLVGCSIYLGWLSWKVLLSVVLVIAIGTFGYRPDRARLPPPPEGARHPRHSVPTLPRDDGGHEGVEVARGPSPGVPL
jgi:putative pyoverdin transport system ATP-binding/permease protein